MLITWKLSKHWR